MLDFQLKQTAFRYGLAEDTDPHAVPFGVLTRLENYVWKTSALLEKRLGVSALGTGILGGGNITEGVRLFARGAELCLVDGETLYGYSSSQAVWENKGKPPALSMTWETTIDHVRGVKCSDMAVSGNIEVRAWVTGDATSSASDPGSDVFVEIVDRVSGEVLFSPSVLGSAFYYGIRVLIVNGVAVVLSRGVTAAPHSIRAWSFNLTTFTAIAPAAGTVLVADVTANGWDACVIGTTFVIAYNRTGNTLALESYTSALVSAASGTVVDVAGANMVSIAGTSGGSLYVGYEQTGARPRPIRVAINNPATLAAVVAPITVETPYEGMAIAVSVYDATNCILAYNVQESDNRNRLSTVKVSNLAVANTSTFRATWFVYPTTRPFLLDGRCYIAGLGWNSLAADSVYAGFSSGLWEIEFTNDGVGLNSRVPHRLVGKIDMLTGGMIPLRAPRPEPCVISSTLAVMPIPFLSSAAPAVSNWRCGVRKLSVEPGPNASDWCRSFVYGNEAFLAGSGFSTFDGRHIFDYGFFQAPNINTFSTAAVGGLMLSGTYLYGALQEYRSATGLLYRSETAVGVDQLTVGPTGMNTLLLSTESVTNKQDLVTGVLSAARPSMVAMYRTVANGSIYQRLAYEPLFNVSLVVPTSGYVTFEDRRPDTDITGGSGALTPLAGRPALYTENGTLEDHQPPASLTQFYHVDRLWLLSGDGLTWWYSKAFRDDIGVAPGFNPAFRIVFDKTQTAGATLEEKAIFFSVSSIAYMNGIGPTKDGEGSDFSSPIPLPADVGCVNPRSLVSTPDGLMFESSRGIYLLSRGLETVWVGRPVKETLALYPIITSAVLVAKYSEVRFTCNDETSENGVVLIYNLVEKQWSIAKYMQTADGEGTAIADACLYLGNWACLVDNGTVYVENEADAADAHLDDDVYVEGVIETAWISPAGPIAYHSVRSLVLLGESASNHDLTVELAFDSSDAYQQHRTFAAGSEVTTIGPLEECQVQFGKRRKCSSFRVRITDSRAIGPIALGNGKGPSFSAMGIEVGIKRGSQMSVWKKG